MNETAVLDLDIDLVRGVFAVLRRLSDNPEACDHCNHGDHATCHRWYRDVCRCPHPTAEEAQQ